MTYTDDQFIAWQMALNVLYAKYPVRGASAEEMEQYNVTGDPVAAEHRWRASAVGKPDDGVLYLTGTSIPLEEVTAIYTLLFG
jgi:hypothetical protein